MNLDTVVAGGYTLEQVLIAVGSVVAVLFMWAVLKKLLAGQKESAHTQHVECSCGWQGRVSTQAGRCPKCNQPLGNRQAR